jgi:hypothetical protein
MLCRLVSGPFENINGSPEEWLTERHCFFQQTKKKREKRFHSSLSGKIACLQVLKWESLK